MVASRECSIFFRLITYFEMALMSLARRGDVPLGAEFENHHMYCIYSFFSDKCVNQQV
jgi:hypothetical protein